MREIGNSRQSTRFPVAPFLCSASHCYGQTTEKMLRDLVTVGTIIRKEIFSDLKK